MKNLYLIILCLSSFIANSKTLIVGLDSEKYQFTSLRNAAVQAVPGDTIILTVGIYSGGEYIEDLSGTSDSPIIIKAREDDTVIYRGGSQAIHFAQLENVVIDGLIFEGQTANGVNIDDAGSYDTPSNNIIIQNCIWNYMDANGNNDELKLSGVDNFIIRNCSFKNGSAGGSLVDMVGCHQGDFVDNHFENAGSNCIQAKGGTSDINIERNLFINGGARAINIGGSTGLQFFRPLGVDYEAKTIKVYSNIFIGSQAPVCYVGAIYCDVVNNTIINPDKWAIRILQESVDGFQKCGNNAFVNNICYLNNNNSVYTLNIGSNTAPETFFFANNLWYNYENENWQGPNLPVEELNGIINKNPLFVNISDNDFNLSDGSPAIGTGFYDTEKIQPPLLDYYGKSFNKPPTIGAIEKTPVDIKEALMINPIYMLSPNPAINYIAINCVDRNIPFAITDIKLYNVFGVEITPEAGRFSNPIDGIIHINISKIPSGIYFLRIENMIQKFVKI